MLGRVRRSGTLHIECAERQIDVHFVQGRIAETRDSTRVYADTVLGSLLIKRSLVTEEQLDQALREQESDPRPIGTILVRARLRGRGRPARGALAPGGQHASWPSRRPTQAGTFMFVIDDTAEPVDYITIDTHSVLIEVSAVGRRLRRRLRARGRRQHRAGAQPRLRDAAAPPHAHGARRVPRAHADRRPAHGERGRRGQPPRRGHRHLHPGQVLPGQGAAHERRTHGRAARRRASCAATATACATRSCAWALRRPSSAPTAAASTGRSTHLQRPTARAARRSGAPPTPARARAGRRRGAADDWSW